MKRVRSYIGKSAIGIAVAVLAMCCMAQGQSGSGAPPPGRRGFGPGPMSEDAMGFVGFEAGLGGKTVTGAPFTATFSTTSAQSLADGNQIQRTTSGSLDRDSQGRTRRDLTLPALGPLAASGQSAPHFVFINDAVAGMQYILDPDRKIAREMKWRGPGKRGQGAPPNGQSGPPPGNQSNVTTVSLGTQTIGGVQAEGTRITRTIPAGAIGNANPIVITTERWYSSDLQTVVMTKTDDPRMGQTVFQLTNIQRQEPDASLFQVPSDYTVKQGGPGKPMGRKRGQGPPPPDGAFGPPPPSQD
jgi:hypothetical protein